MSTEVLGLGDLVDMLGTNLIKQFHAEEHIARIHALETPSDEELAEAGRIALKIRTLNLRRVRLKNAINALTTTGTIELRLNYAGGDYAEQSP